MKYFFWLKRKRVVRRKNVNTKRYFQYKEQARNLVNSRLKILNEKYNFQYGRISIRNQKSRWGSCSKKGNMNFNFRIFLLPPHLADYIIVHELCHRGEFNHSNEFWDLVAQTIPNYPEMRNELNKTRII